MTSPGTSTERLARLDAVVRRVPQALVLAGVSVALFGAWRVHAGVADEWSVVLPLGAALVFGAPLLFSPARRVASVAAAVPVLGVLGMAELAVGVFQFRQERASAGRDMAQVVRDLRDTGVPAAQPASHARGFVKEPLVVDGGAVVPLSGIARSREVLCREGSTWRHYATDALGFPNPDDAWSQPTDVVLLGDSFVQGYCVDEAQAFAGLLRARARVINLGGSGNGPLVELGTLVEFGARAAPRAAWWFFYEQNDIDDLAHEATQPLLTAYLQPGATQRLLDRVDAVQAAQRRHVEARLAAPPEAPTSVRTLSEHLLAGLKLGHLRLALGVVRSPAAGYARYDQNAARVLLPRVMARMVEVARGLNAPLHMVYIPGRDAFTSVGFHPERAGILKAAAAAGIPVLDLYETFKANSDPLSLYSVPHPAAHLSVAGNAAVAAALTPLLPAPR